MVGLGFIDDPAIPLLHKFALIGGANIEYYLTPARIINLLFHIRTFYELSNYLEGGISLFNQTIKWLNKKVASINAK